MNRFQCINRFLGHAVAGIAGLLCGVASAADLSPRQAVIVSVSEYAHRDFTKLKYTDRDGARLAAVLKSLGYDVQHLCADSGKSNAKLRPTSANIRAVLENFPASDSQREVALVVFTGHGLQPLGMKESFFCPQDADPELKAQGTGSVPAKPASLIGVNWALTEVHKKGYKTTLVMVDACRDDPRADSIKGGKKNAGIQTVVFDVPDQAGLLLSCSRREYSWEIDGLGGKGAGAFLHHVIAGLEGAAADQQGRVTWSRLQTYVEEAVPQTVSSNLSGGASQTPSHQARFEGVVVLGVRPQTGPKPLVWPFDESAAKAGQTAWAKSLGKPVVEKNTVGMELVVIPAGTYTMGSPAGESGRSDDENQVSVTLTKAFQMSRTEVTQGQWKAVMGTEPWLGNFYMRVGTDHAATHVNWVDASEFCRKISAREGVEYRLPTEAEWEWACRAGTKTAWSFFGDERELGRYAITEKTRSIWQQHAQSVGQKLPNGFGLSDIHGNVSEWCEDVYADQLTGGRDPLSSEGSSRRVCRGGAWSNQPDKCRSAQRLCFDPSGRWFFLGFRVVLRQSGR